MHLTIYISIFFPVLLNKSSLKVTKVKIGKIKKYRAMFNNEQKTIKERVESFPIEKCKFWYKS